MFKKLMALIFILSTQGYAKENSMQTIYDFKITKSDGEETTLLPHKGKVILIVNVASKCGFTPQYEGLETLYQQYKDKGLVIIGFPCNQFGEQEPGTNEQIQNFCRINYGVSFPVFSKIDVNGKDTHPLYLYLKQEKSGIFGTEAIKWNFTKFLIDKEGRVTDRFAPSTTPKGIEDDINKLLDQ